MGLLCGNQMTWALDRTALKLLSLQGDVMVIVANGSRQERDG